MIFSSRVASARATLLTFIDDMIRFHAALDIIADYRLAAISAFRG